VAKLTGQFPKTSISFGGIAAIFQFQSANFLYYVNLAGLGLSFVSKSLIFLFFFEKVFVAYSHISSRI